MPGLRSAYLPLVQIGNPDTKGVAGLTEVTAIDAAIRLQWSSGSAGRRWTALLQRKRAPTRHSVPAARLADCNGSIGLGGRAPVVRHRELHGVSTRSFVHVIRRGADLSRSAIAEIYYRPANAPIRIE